MLQPGHNSFLSHEFFNTTWLEEKGYLTAQKNTGRACVYFFKYKKQHFVLRQYYRGGLPSKIIQSHYLWCGLQKTRAYQEIDLLEKMYDLALPISRPLAARVCKGVLTYEAALITYQVDNSRSLGEVLQFQELSSDNWGQIGCTIRRFHDKEVYHSDLNANNILINDKEEFYLIDFDKGSLRNSVGDAWKIQNLERLKRSLHKLNASYPIFYFSDQSWSCLLDGYKIRTI